MNELVIPVSAVALPSLPQPRAAVSIREAMVSDVAFIDRLQKLHSDRVGFMRESWIEARIKAQQVLVAEAAGGTPGTQVGYVMATDRYFKRDDVGIIYQLNVAPVSQRKLIGATLLKAVFDHAAYGCRLFCCWCAQDIEANRFWESMGFVPLAFRAGSEKKSRVHIFWQKRIRAGDMQTPWWFPAKTDGGLMREDRLVFPIPPGKHWTDEMPRILPSEATQPALDDQRGGNQSRRSKAGYPSTAGPVKHGPRQYGPPPLALPVAEAVVEKLKREKKPKKKADPTLVAAARELRDLWLERVNADPAMLTSQPKYEISRLVAPLQPSDIPLLPNQLAA